MPCGHLEIDSLIVCVCVQSSNDVNTNQAYYMMIGIIKHITAYRLTWLQHIDSWSIREHWLSVWLQNIDWIRRYLRHWFRIQHTFRDAWMTAGVTERMRPNVKELEFVPFHLWRCGRLMMTVTKLPAQWSIIHSFIYNSYFWYVFINGLPREWSIIFSKNNHFQHY